MEVRNYTDGLVDPKMGSVIKNLLYRIELFL
jgi:hypothetical protein